jgi:hypothetical protein
MEHFRSVDWPEVLERLTLEALRLFQASRFTRDGVLASFGDGFEDLAQDVILAFLDETNPKVSWNAARAHATTDGVVAYLRPVLQHDFLDRVRRKRLKNQHNLVKASEDEEKVAFVVDPRDPSPDAEALLVRRETLAPLRKRLEDDFQKRPDDSLQLYVMLQFDGDDCVPYPPREAAAELGIEAPAIYLLKEKLERRLNRLFKEELNAARARQERLHEQEAR